MFRSRLPAVVCLGFVVLAGASSSCGSSTEANGSSEANGKIAFTSYRDGNKEIYVMNVDGTDRTNLTNNEVIDGDPAFSPDGTRIAFGRSGEIYVMNSDGTEQTNLTNDSMRDTEPAFSPDGTQIAFTSRPPRST